MKENNFTLVQLNFWRGRLYYPITRFLERVQPDIFVAQEMLFGPGDSFVDMMTAEMLVSEKHRYFDEFVLSDSLKEMRSINRGYQRDEACAIFSKNPYTIIEHRKVTVGEPEKRWGGGYYNLLHATVKTPFGKKIHILNYHGEVVLEDKTRMGSAITDRNFEQISNYISNLTGAVVISGDFNLDKQSSPLKFLKSVGLENLNDRYGFSSGGRNEFSWRPEELVSHIFVNEYVTVNDYYIADDNVSDHKALVMSGNIKT